MVFLQIQTLLGNTLPGSFSYKSRPCQHFWQNGLLVWEFHVFDFAGSTKLASRARARLRPIVFGAIGSVLEMALWTEGNWIGKCPSRTHEWSAVSRVWASPCPRNGPGWRESFKRLAWKLYAREKVCCKLFIFVFICAILEARANYVWVLSSVPISAEVEPQYVWYFKLQC